MDIQRKKGMLEVCVLAVLKKGASYGYRIAREVEQCVDISESTLYPILKRLEQNHCLKTYRQEYNGRMRKYYCLTQEGQNKIDGFLDEWEELQKMYHFVAEQNQAEPFTEAPEAAGDSELSAEAPESAGDSEPSSDPSSEAPEAVGDSEPSANTPESAGGTEADILKSAAYGYEQRSQEISGAAKEEGGVQS